MSEIVIHNGETSTGLVADSGDVIIIEAGGTLVDGVINDGGVLSATYGAVAENLTAATGATVELTGTAKTSGLMLTGANTNIAEGTLHYMGEAVTGTVTNGTISNLNGVYRVCIGAGITAADPIVGGETTVGVRIYANDTAIVSGGSITTSGNIGILGEGYGNGVIAGGEDVTAATYNIFNNATADNTTVKQGGTFTVRDNAVADGVTVEQGGQLRVSGGELAAPVARNVTVNEGGTLHVSNGGAVSGGTVNRGGVLYVRNGEISGLTLYAKAEDTTIQISGGGALMSGGTICGVATGKAYAKITSGAVLRDVVLTTEATTSAANLLWASAGDQPAASTGSAFGYNVTVDNFARLQIYHGVFSDTKVVSGAWLYLTHNGVADNTLVSGVKGGNKAHMDINCAHGGYAINTWIASGGQVNVSDGKALDTTVSDGGTLNIVLATASADGVVISSGGQVNVSNGKALNTTVSSGGTLNIALATGSAGGVLVSSGGRLYINGGTVRNAEILLGGSTLYLSNGTLSGATLTAQRGNTAYVEMSGGGLLRDITLTGSGTAGNAARIRIGWKGTATPTLENVTARDYAWLQCVKANGSNVDVLDGSYLSLQGGTIEDVTFSGYKYRRASGTVSNATLDTVMIGSGAEVTVSGGGVVRDVTVNKDGILTVSANGVATLAWLPETWSGTVTRVGDETDVTQLDRDKKVYYGNASLGLLSKTDVLEDLHIKERYYSVNVYDGGIVNNVRVDNYSYFYVYSGGTVNDGLLSNGYMSAAPGAVVSGLTARGDGAFVWFSGAVLKDVYLSGGSLSLYGNGTVTNANVYNGVEARAYGGTCNSTTVGGFFGVSAAAASARDTVISSGGSMYIYNIGTHTDTTVKAGGQIDIRTTNLGKTARGTFTIDFTGAEGQDIYTFTSRTIADAFNNLSVNAEVVVKASEKQGDYSYNILYKGGQYNNAFVLDLGDGVTYATGKDTGAIINPFTGMQYERTSNAYVSSGATLYDLRLVTMQTAHVITAVDTAAALATSGSTLNGSDREARWTENTTCGDTVYAAEGMTTGNAWLDIDGANVDKALYGAAANQNFAGVVNMKLTDGSIRNLAAGAAAGGSVKAVNFRMTGGELAGNAYLGGMGDVTEAVTATVESGELAAGKNLYAGALWNYKNQTGATSVGSVNLTVKAGTIKGNVYGASAVKTGTITTTAATDARHTVGDVTLTLAGGTTANAEFCAFAGGYATGTDSAKLASVYDVGDVSISVTGGTWGDAADARGGRGVFGGVFASGVKATARNVSITVEAGTVANVFGGGWAQKGGESTVENVSIVVTGGTVANIFGCGIHSVSVSENGASTTSVGDVSITLAGGNVTDNVYARGLIDGDAVTGDVTVTVTGSADYGCNFYGFSRTAGEDDKAELVFADYTRTISGEVNGFKEIALSGDTAMTFTSTDISNTAWLFDATERTDAGSVFATGTTVDFSNATVTLNLAEEAVRSDWSIFAGGADTAYDKFDVQIGGVDIATGLELDQAIAGGDYAGWGFTVEDTVLKFKNLA